MGKRKSRNKPQTNKKMKEEIPKHFSCPYCSHKDSISVKMARMERIGNLSCMVCDIKFEAPIHNLSEPIDVYSAWIDSIDAFEREDQEQQQDIDFNNPLQDLELAPEPEAQFPNGDRDHDQVEPAPPSPQPDEPVVETLEDESDGEDHEQAGDEGPSVVGGQDQAESSEQ